MSSQLILSIQDGAVIYSGKPVFENLSFNIHQGHKIALVGNNGAGKTTLMHMITGERELDAGERWEENGLSIGYLQQDMVPQKGQSVFDYIMEEIEAEHKSAHEYKVDMITNAVRLDAQALMETLSGGQIRRAALARALVENPDILLMDEPTNHLDLEAIEWLEGYLKSYRGTVLCVSHDRTFLSNITDTVFWLDRGQIRVSPKGFKHFEDWSNTLIEQEARELKNRKTFVQQEVEWANRGVKARVKRNVRRVERMKELRAKFEADQSAYRRAMAKVSVTPTVENESTSRVVAEFYNVGKSFQKENGEELPILKKFSLKIMRGERIGILGKNGSGKTTFLKMLTRDLTPDAGRLKISKAAEISYFDQRRRDLVPTQSLRKTLCPNGGEFVTVNGKERHVCGYLKNFMFDPSEVERAVETLSGGEKNRLLLAKILANPGNFMILDEPTNDLDMDTLDMLEEALCNYTGTLFVVSHDRDFLDQTVTKILAFEGEGCVETHLGGYSDYLKARNAKIAQKKKKTQKQQKNTPAKAREKTATTDTETSEQHGVQKSGKMTYKLKHELEKLPQKIERTEKEIAALNALLSDSGLYEKDPDKFHEAVKDLAEMQNKLERYETRWLELDEFAAQIG